jgi:hypothetical protein
MLTIKFNELGTIIKGPEASEGVAINWIVTPLDQQYLSELDKSWPTPDLIGVGSTFNYTSQTYSYSLSPLSILQNLSYDSPYVDFFDGVKTNIGFDRKPGNQDTNTQYSVRTTIRVGRNIYVGPILNAGISKTIDYSTVALTGTVAGTLIRHINDSVTALKSGKVPGDLAQKFWKVNNSGKSTTSLLSGLYTDFMALGNGNEKFVLVSSRHCLTVGHMVPSVGSSLTFKNSDTGQSQTVTVAATYAAGTPGSGANELGLIYLSAPVTVVTPAKVVPSDIGNYIPGAPTNVGALNQLNISGQLMNVTINSHDNTAASSAAYIQIKAFMGYASGQGTTYLGETDKFRYDVGGFTGGGAYSGDSGSPEFCLINGELIYCGAASNSGGQSYSVASQFAITQQKMNDIAASNDIDKGSYRLITPALNMFPRFLLNN